MGIITAVWACCPQNYSLQAVQVPLRRVVLETLPPQPPHHLRHRPGVTLGAVTGLAHRAQVGRPVRAAFPEWFDVVDLFIVGPADPASCAWYKGGLPD